MSDSVADPEQSLPRGQREPLTVDEIRQLDAALMLVFRTIIALREQNEAACHVKFPPLPPIFSESIVIAATRAIFGAEWRGRFGGTRCDVIVENSCGERKAVEVKATGRHEFQELKDKDLRADVLVWVRFGHRYEDGHGRIEIVTLEHPGSYIQKPCRLDTRRFERISGVADLQLITFGSLDELLEGVA